MIFPEFHELKTERLVLRKLSMEDVPLFYERLGGSEKVTEYMLWEPHKDISQSAASIQNALRRYDQGKFYRWAISRKENSEIIGIIDLLRFDEESSTCSFAYMLGEAFWNRGYSTEALKAVLNFASVEMQISSVIADHMSGNPASGAVMRKAGMQHIRTIPGKYEKHGNWMDAEEYRIVLSADPDIS